MGIITCRGSFISHSVINQYLCSFAVQQQDGTAIGTTHELPSGSLITTFRIGGAGSKDVSFDPIFKRKEDFAAAAEDPGSEVQQVIAKIARSIANDVIDNAFASQKEAETAQEPDEALPVTPDEPLYTDPEPVTTLAPSRTPGTVTGPVGTPMTGVLPHDPGTPSIPQKQA